MVTIKDVARAAGVSVATVSRAHNKSRLVTETTGRRVRAVAERLGYSPHAAARSLSTRHTSTIGVLLPDLYGEFYYELIRGIDQTAQRHGFHLLLASSHNERDAITAALQSMRGRVDGLVVMSPALGAHLAVRDLPASYPVVLLNSAATGAAFDAITIANARGAADMVQHLVGRGPRRRAMRWGWPGSTTSRWRATRIRRSRRCGWTSRRWGRARRRGCSRRWATTAGIASGGSGSPSRW